MTKWNDDRGFGFITPANGSGDLFVHISAFPREGGRPSVNELISFEVEAGPDGKRRAVRVMRPGQRRPQGSKGTGSRRPARANWLSAAMSIIAIVGIGAFAYTHVTKRTAPIERIEADHTDQPDIPDSGFSCDGRTKCSQMTSCAEATYFIRNCPNTTMDGNSDGVPCESQWCN